MSDLKASDAHKQDQFTVTESEQLREDGKFSLLHC